MSIVIPDALLATAEARHGVLSTRELRKAGIGSTAQHRRFEARFLEQEIYGVVVVPSLRDAFTHLAALQLVWPDLVAERRTAAAIWRLDRIRDWGCLDLVAPTKSRSRYSRLVIVRRADLSAKAITVHEGLRVTTPTWTLGELGACDGIDTDQVELALESALHRKLTTESRLHLVVTERPAPAWPGSAVLSEALGRRARGAPPTQSYAETRFLQRVVRLVGLEDPERQAEITVRGRHKPYHADFLFRGREPGDRDVDVEIDGLHPHGTPEAHDRDLRRDEQITQTGCVVTRFAAWRVDRDRAAVCAGLASTIKAARPRPAGPRG